MEIGSEFFSSTKIAEPRALPRPKLLLELEPAYRVFFSNLWYALRLRPAPQVGTISPPGQFWPDVFVRSEMPWWGFLESMLWHMLAVAGLWSLSQGVALRNQPFQRPTARRTYISYYRPSPTYPMAGARPPQPPAVRGKERSNQPALKVAREARRSREGAAPDLKLGETGEPNLPAVGGSLPEMPFSATRGSRLNVPAGPNALVAPPPEVYQLTGRRGRLPQAGVIAPPPEIGDVSSRRGLGAPGSAVVEPPPSLQGALRKFGDVNIAHADVVAPAPRLPMHEQRAGVGADQAGLGGSSTSVVPPPPLVERSGTVRGGRIGSMAAGGTHVVPPPPSIQEAGGVGRPGALSSNGVQVVPPPPSVEGVGNAAGRGRGTALVGNNFGVVPPAPSTSNLKSTSGGGRGTQLSGGGFEVVPPPPSMQGTGIGAGRGRGTEISGSGSDVVPPAPSVRGGNGSIGGVRGGAFGGTGLQAAGPPGPGAGSGVGSTRGGLGGSPSGKGSSAGAGSDAAATTGRGGALGGAGSGEGGASLARGSGPGGTGANGSRNAGPSAGSGNTGTTGSGGVSGGTGASAGASGGSGSSGGSPSASGGAGSSAKGGSPAGSGNGTSEVGNPGGSGRALAADVPSARPPILDNPPGPTDLPVRVIGLAMALPSSSYFSNYEVFIAERRISRDESQLIKLVYVSLPYQRRLSEYGLNNRVFKLRVIRDPSCDESLMQMTWPDTDQSKTATQPAADPPELKSERNDRLPCYRTTADDYRKAISRSR